MQVNSIQNYSYSVSDKNSNPAFGNLRFKRTALKKALWGIENAVDIKVESDNLGSAREVIKTWTKMFSEPWNLRVRKGQDLPEFVEEFDKMGIRRIDTKNMAKYNERLASLGNEADDLTVNVTGRVRNKKGDITYTVDVPAFGVKSKKVVLDGTTHQPDRLFKEIPTEQEVNSLKRVVYEDIVGKDIASNSLPNINEGLKNLISLMKNGH